MNLFIRFILNGVCLLIALKGLNPNTLSESKPFVSFMAIIVITYAQGLIVGGSM